MIVVSQVSSVSTIGKRKQWCTMQWAERVDSYTFVHVHVKLCPLASGKHRIGPKMVSEAIS